MEETYQDRLKAERDQLADRANKLADFVKGVVFPTIAPLQQTLLKAQLGCMDAYLAILEVRLEAL